MERKNTNTITNATAIIQGGKGYPDLTGLCTFEQTDWGVVVTIQVNGLPRNSTCNDGIFALHIHEGGSCAGTKDDPFSNAGTHYNPSNCPHPYHAGDLPPLMGNDGLAYMSVLTNRFTVQEVIGRVIVVHEGKDDFTSQPAGNAGSKIGCGEIVSV